MGMKMSNSFDALIQKVAQQLAMIYNDVPINMSLNTLALRLIDEMGITEDCSPPAPYSNHWSEQDIIMITYGDSLLKAQEKPLRTLQHFAENYLQDHINSIHILPFFPFSSDDGFSVIDYSSVNESLGDWCDIQAIAKKRRLMSDLVINHCSSRSLWFENFIKGEGQGHDYFFTAKCF